jgi:hypothetical protein
LFHSRLLQTAHAGSAGGGDRAIEANPGLASGGRNRVTLVHRGADLALDRERNEDLLNLATAEGRMFERIEARLRSIGEDSGFAFVHIGGETPDAFLRRAGIQFIEKAVAA